MNPRPFRFGVNLLGLPAPFPALVSAAEATARPITVPEPARRDFARVMALLS